ncbi:acid-sensing ion channel 5 [Diorhabda carinulata]|uniref:acid-sensing ion channel 5 n=1 Tax=Diorhabda carinulata TaxID=1163345 RepID=UPI0025A02723|nr:acid-sensing ion channel 5 [Diorhabda carinulata]
MKILPTSNCFKDPSQLIKFVILFICAIFTFSQVTQCVKKFIHPPTATYSKFILNDSIRYPCVTVCRRPSFKTEVFKTFGIYSQSLTSSFAFKYFNFSKHSLTEFIENATYKYDEMFYQYAYASKGGSDTSNELIKLTSLYHIDRGRCFTFQPLKMSNIFSVSGGFMFYLKHNVTSQSINQDGISTHGYQFYLHNPNEHLTYADEERNNFLEYIDLEASEDMRIKFDIKQFGRTSTNENHCIEDGKYSRSKCEELCINREIAQITNCTVPWMVLPENETFEECNTYSSVKTSIRLYTNDVVRNHFLENCNCPLSCNFTIYKTSIISRRSIESALKPDCMIRLYCTNLILTMSEILGYDSNQLLSDIGGSLGFLLGLSVISLICLLEEISRLIFRLFFKQKAKHERNKNEEINQDNQTNNQQSNEINKTIEAEFEHGNNLEGNTNLVHDYTNIKEIITNYQNVYSKNYTDNKTNTNTEK